MCEQCLSAAIEIEIDFLPGWKLYQATRDGCLMKTGSFALVHKSDPDPVLVFSCTAFDKDFHLQLGGSFYTTWRWSSILFSACSRGGYNPDICGITAEHWLWKKLKKVIKG